MKIKIQGTIIPDDYADVYEWLGLTFTAPKDIKLPETGEQVDVEINSYGGDVYAGSEIYTALKNYPGKVTITITGIAASMASVIAMAGDVVRITPTGQIMIHNVSSYSEGNKNDFKKESDVLAGFDKTLANAYQLKTNLDHSELLKLMDKETWLTPQDALEKGFVDEILFTKDTNVLKIAAGVGMLSDEVLAKARMAMLKETIKDTKETDGLEGNEMDGTKMTDEAVKVNEAEVTEKVTAEEVEIEESVKETEVKAGEKIKEPDKENVDDHVVKINAHAIAGGNIAVGVPNLTIGRNGLTFKNEANPQKLNIIGGIETMKTYKDAFLNAVRGIKLDNEDFGLIASANKSFSDAFTHDTTNTAIVIPQETQDKNWARAIEGYGVLEDVNRLHVKGELRMVKHKAIEEGDATWYVEATPTADEKNTFGDLVLKGHELSKAVTISWKLRSMAMADFESFLVREIGDRISIALGTAVTQGTGKDQPTGILTAVKKDKEQAANVAKTGTVTYAELLGLVSKVHSAYKTGAKIYANSTVIWTVLANIVDANGRPFFEATAGADGVGNALGFTVKEDASLKNDEILFGNPGAGYVFNVNEEMTMTTEDHAKERKTDYVAYMIADGNVLDEKAFAVLNLTQAV